jgi:glycosyltransferase 2 family protein
MKGDKKSLKKTLLKLVVSTVLLYAIFSRVDLVELRENISLLDYRYAIFVPLFIIIHYFVGGFRWKQLLTHEDADGVEVSYLINLYFIGSFFNNFMPTSVGGDVYKMLQLGKKIGNKAVGFSSTFMERFTGMVSLVLISYYGLVRTLPFWVDLLPPEVQQSPLLVTLFKIGMFSGFWIAGLVGFASLKFMATKIVFFRKIHDSLMVYKDQKRELFVAFLTSFIIQALSILPQYFIFLALGVEVPFTYAIFVLPVIALAGFFVPSLNGLGVQDALYISFFGMVGVSESMALSASILYHFSRLLVSLIGGVLYALGKGD